MSKEMKLKQYMFTFQEGGWNTVWAKTLKGAQKEALLKYGNEDNLNPIPSSVHKVTEEGMFNAMSNFY